VRWTELRAKVGALVTILLLLLIIAALAAYKGCNIPFLSAFFTNPTP